MKATVLCLALSIAICSVENLPAQVVYGSIAGNVVDATSAVVPEAKVTIRDLDRGTTASTTTNGSGNFRQGALIAGRYSVRVEKMGFRSYVQNDITVSVDQEASLSISLQVGQASDSVEVTAEASLLKADKSDVAIVFSQKLVEDIPVVGRRFSSLSLLTPGVTQTSGNPISTESENPMGAYRLSVNGQMYSSVAHLLDGTDNHDSVLAYQVINPPLDAVTEAKVTTNAFDAEIGMAGAMVVSSQTKSGTNQLHGSLFEYLRNDHLQARNPFTQSRIISGSTRVIPVTIWNQYGGSLGGPIKKDKLFIFGDYQGTDRRTGGSVNTWVPTAAMRGGDLSTLGVNIYDPSSGSTPATRSQYPGNVMPSNLITPQAQNLLKLIPLPNNTAAGPNQPNYTGSGSVALKENSFDVRGDDYLTSKLQLFGRYSLQRFNLTSPALFGLAGGSGFDASAFAGTSFSDNRSIAAGGNYSVSPTLVTDARFGWFRYYVNVNPLGVGTTPAKDAGIPGLNLGDNFTSGMPQITGLPNGLNLGFGLGANNCNCPLIENQHQFQFVNNWTKRAGNHTVKFGFDFRHAYNLRVPSDSHRAGQLVFADATTSGPSGGGSAMASFLGGTVSSFSRYVSPDLTAAEMQNRIFGFVQDTWQLSSRLTLNYGIRFENYRPQYTNAGQGGRVDSSTGTVLVAGQNGVSPSMNTSSPPKGFAPRLGVSYRATNRTVIRVGYGRGFSLGIFGAVFGHNVTQNLPVLAAQQVNPSASYATVFTLAQGPPAVLNPGDLLASQPKGPGGNYLLPNGVGADITPSTLRIPTVDSWNFTIQQQLSRSSSLEVAYIGNKGTHVQPGYNFGYNTNEVSLAGYGTLSTSQRRPLYNLYGWTQTTRYSGNDSSSHYEAMQAKIEKRFAGGLQFLSHFTWSKAMDFDNNYFMYNRSLDYGPSSQNRNLAFVFTGSWEIPVGVGRRFSVPKTADYVVGGWQMNTVFTWTSGLPFIPGYQNCTQDQDTGDGNLCRADVVGPWQVSNPGQNGWFATCSSVLTANGQGCGAWARPQKGQIGNVGRDTLYGPHFAQLDFSVFKEVALRERLKLQVRAEAFNFGNHTNLGQPVVTVDAPGRAGRIFATAGTYIPETWQMGMRLQF